MGAVSGVLIGYLVVAIATLAIWFWRRSRRPAITLLEPLDIGLVIGRVPRLVRAEHLPLVLLAILFIGVPRTLSASLFPLHSPGAGGIGGFILATWGRSGLLGLLGLGFQLPAMTQLIAHFEGRPLTIGAALGRLVEQLFNAVGLSFLVGIAAIAGLLFLVWPAFLVLTTWSVALPILLNEEASITESLETSRRLTTGSRGRILLTLLLFYVVIFGGAWTLGFSAGRMFIGQKVVLAAVTGFAGVVGGLIGVALIASLYVELRRIHGGGSASGDLADIFA